MVPVGQVANGVFFNVGKYDKNIDKLIVSPGAIYNVKLRVAKDKSWKGQAWLTVTGFGTKLEPFPLAENKKVRKNSNYNNNEIMFSGCYGIGKDVPG